MSDQGIFGGLKSQAGDYAQALGRKAFSSASEQVEKIADRLDGNGGSMGEGAKKGAEKVAEGKSPISAAASAVTAGAGDKVKGLFGGGSKAGGGSDNKFMNIVEWTDVGVPLKTAYNAFTEFENWPDFMKKVENVERLDDVKLKFKGQVFLSHRTWEATITEQVADSHIVWESTGEKGHISGSVSFHEVTPTLTRMLTIGEYHPQGFMERTGNLWRAVGRRFRLELKFFVHHVMTEVILDPESVEGWRGEIRDGEVVTSHEDALEQEAEEEEAQEQEESESQAESEPYGEDEEGAEAEDDYAEEEEPAEDAPVEEEYAEEEEPAEEAPAEDEYAEEEEPAEEAPAEDEYAEEEEPAEEAPAEDDYADEEEPAEEAPAEEEPAEEEAEYDEETQEADEEPEPR